MAQAIPKDRTLTVDEAIERLQVLEPGRDFNPESVRTLFPEMTKQGLIRKVRRTAGRFAHRAHMDLEVTDDLFACLSYADTTERVLAEKGPLADAEIVVALKESGYKPVDAPPEHAAVPPDSFKWNRKRFRRGGDGRWAVK